jgi:hypothetical protein
MSNVYAIIKPTLEWIREDWESDRLRFIVEVVAWGISIGCAIVMALTVPNPPLIILYPIWIFGCSLYAWAAWTRRSFGMLANYMLLVAIDTTGLIRMLLAL